MSPPLPADELHILEHAGGNVELVVAADRLQGQVLDEVPVDVARHVEVEPAENPRLAEVGVRGDSEIGSRGLREADVVVVVIGGDARSIAASTSDALEPNVA